MAGKNVAKNKKFGDYVFDTWHKDKDPGARDACGGKRKLGNAQEWARSVGRQVPTHVNSASDFRDVIDNCKAYQAQKDQKDEVEVKDDPGPQGPAEDASIEDLLTTPVAYVDGEGMSAAEYDLYRDEYMANVRQQDALEMQQLLGSQEAMIQGLRNEANALNQATSTTNRTIAEEGATYRTQYAADAEKDWRKYLGDVSYKTTTDKAKIDGEYSLDLREIINAGNKEVENIRGEYGLGAERIRGEYGKEIEGIRGGYQKDIAKTNRDAQVFGNFVAGFWN